MRILFRLLLLVFLIFLLSGTGTAQSMPASPISITISAAQNVVKTGSEIKIQILLKNVSNHEIGIERSPGENDGESHNKIEVHDDKGNLARETGYKRALEGGGGYDEVTGRFIMPGGSSIRFSLKPGETIKDGIAVNKLYYLTKPAKYTIKCQRFDEESNSWAKSNTITITVTP